MVDMDNICYVDARTGAQGKKMNKKVKKKLEVKAGDKNNGISLI